MEQKYIFLDIDGVMTSMAETPGSYKTHDGSSSEYGISNGPFRALTSLMEETGAKVIISSNWRKFDETGPHSIWNNSVYGPVINPLPRLKAMLGCNWLDNLPKTRHMTKSQTLRLWFSQRNADCGRCKYVIFDDDPHEGFAESEFCEHFIMTDCTTGLTREDCEKAKRILES